MRFYWPISKIDAEQHMVWGYASTDAVDDQGETVTRDALAAALDDYMRFANIREMHQPSAVGVAKEAAVDDRGLYLGAKIVDQEAWAKIVEGVYKGFSIGGRIMARSPSDRTIITGLKLTEISVVDRPANPEAVFDCWKRGSVGDAADRVAAAPYGDVDYADRPDRRQRYPIDTEQHIRAAWAYIHRPHNAGRYTDAQLARIKGRIAAAWRAKIDPDGRPAAASNWLTSAGRTAGKALNQAACLAQIIADLEALCDGMPPGPAGSEHAPSIPERLEGAVAQLCDILENLLHGVGNQPETPHDAGGELAALLPAGSLRKSAASAAKAGPDGLAKLAGEILPRLDALQRRIEEIARTPLPPQTAARGYVAIAKREDGGGPPGGGDDIVAALARMSEEERTLTLIKAAHANPITRGGRYR